MIFRTAIPCTAILIAAALLSTAAAAQYKYTGPDGRVIYSDTPPPAAPKGAKPAVVEKKDVAASAQSASGAGLPFALQQASRNFPVLLYVSANCAGCDAGKAFLTKRGIPFAEKTVKSNEDIAALTKLTGATTVPVLTVGRNKSVGFEAGAWGESLDTAGYPAASQLPAGYKQVAAEPVVPVVADKPAATAEAKPKPEAAPPPPPPPASAADRPTWFKGF